MSDLPLRVLLVDDSPTVRAVIQRILRKTPDLAVVGEAGDGEAGVRLACDLSPDVILMDLVMPKLDGFEATRRIMKRAPTAIMVFSTEVSVEGRRVFEALNRGARDVMAKPGSPEAWTDLAETLPERIRQLARGYRDRQAPEAEGGAQPSEPATARVEAATAATVEAATVEAATVQPIRYLAIGASTGGPEALRALLAGLAPSPPMAVLVVQHIAREFEEGLVEWLRSDSRVNIRVARRGEVVEPGSVRLAPQGYHMRLEAGGRLVLDGDSPPLKGHRPSADVLLKSCAAVAGREAAGVLLSGMGRDGVAGLQAIRKAGGLTLVQDRASSVIFGMPQAALAAGAADLALAPERLARYLLKVGGGQPGSGERRRADAAG